MKSRLNGAWSLLAAAVAILSPATPVCGQVSGYNGADTWKSNAPGWQGSAFDSHYPGLVSDNGSLSGISPALITTGVNSDCCVSNGSPGCDYGACEATVCAQDPFCCNVEWDVVFADAALDLCYVCSIKGLIIVDSWIGRTPIAAIWDMSSEPQVSDGRISSAAGAFLELTFCPDVTAFYAYFGSVAVGERVSMALYDLNDTLIDTQVSAVSGHDGFALGRGFVSTVPIRRIVCTTTDSGVSTVGAFTGLASGVTSLGTVHIPDYQGPDGADVEYDFGVQWVDSPQINVDAAGGGDFITIQEAIDSAACVNSSEIVVAPGTYAERIDLLGKPILVRSSGGAGVTIIDGNGNGPVVTFDSGEGLDTELRGFTITGGNAPVGGGILIDGGSSPRITDCIITLNTSDDGGGMNVRGGSDATISGCTFSDNSADFGAALTVTASVVDVEACVFHENNATFNGGAVEATFGASGVFINCLFHDNSADYGSAVHVFDASTSIVNSTVSGNTTAINAAVSCRSNSIVVIDNSIVWGNTGDELFNDGTATLTVGYTNVEGGSAGPGNINADPLFVNANAGDLHLAAGSPCIDAADNTVTGLAGITTDLDGAPRYVDDPDTADSGIGEPPIVDMGAYEFQGASCPADFDDDDAVGIADLLALLAAWGSDPGGPPDLNDDGTVDVTDLLTLLASWGPCP